jgi:hypothetical protein
LRKCLSLETIDELVHGFNTSPLPITFELKAYEALDECAKLYDNGSESGLQALKQAYRSGLQNVKASRGKIPKSPPQSLLIVNLIYSGSTQPGSPKAHLALGLK